MPSPFYKIYKRDKLNMEPRRKSKIPAWRTFFGNKKYSKVI